MAEESIQASPIKPRLVPPSSSFRLRSKSLNTLRLRRVFDLFDKNGDEYITVAELADALACLGLTTDPAELALTVSGFIQPGAVGLDFNDFQVLVLNLYVPCK
jgi:calcium-binding protein CML